MRPAVTGVGVRAGRGFTLIENMVALAIFAIGVMAIGYLLLDGMSLAQNSRGLTGAYIAAQDMAGMIRANGTNALSYNGIQTPAPGVAASTGGGPPGSVEATDVTTWEGILAALPGSGHTPPSGSVTVAPSLQGTTTCPCTTTILVSWGAGDQYVLQTMVDY
ncbi:MAG: prepilin-type N-terminal cleavage/methylation domain-containing protein [Gammaproteobacteria bacterium]|nr:prepilin-type N-terminal cleavage/methylation domain-containing protein [Gammaproteobacteria bacterium]